MRIPKPYWGTIGSTLDHTSFEPYAGIWTAVRKPGSTRALHSSKLTWKWRGTHYKTTILYMELSMSFHGMLVRWLQVPESKPQAIYRNHKVRLRHESRGPTGTPQLPFKRPQISSNRDHKALNRGTFGGVLGMIIDLLGPALKAKVLSQASLLPPQRRTAADFRKSFPKNATAEGASSNTIRLWVFCGENCLKPSGQVCTCI